MEYFDPYRKNVKRQALLDYLYLVNPHIELEAGIDTEELRDIAAQYVSQG
jgi:hypothetical protein